MRRVRDKIRSFAQERGGRRIKSYVWDIEFSTGRWDCLEKTPGDCLYPCLEKYANKGAVLDLGCGSGNTGNELAANAYREYTGVDISKVAINKARLAAVQNCREAKNQYFQSDILSYVPTQQFDVILLRDSIYYIPRTKIRTMLDRYSGYLNGGGVFIVRMWSAAGRYSAILEAIASQFDVLEKQGLEGAATVIVVFRQRQSRPSV